MFIFYDFETSSKEFLGQILSYSFIVTDPTLHPIDELNGTIRLNRIQLPDIEAIRINQIDITELQATGKSEYESAQTIFQFLNNQIMQYMQCILVGFNSNKFDLQFLRNLLIRYGINPYFDGRLTNLDILHFAKHIALNNLDEFPWTLSTNAQQERYYSFKLEKLAEAFGLLNTPQTHQAKDDVLLTIALVKQLQKQFHMTLSQFNTYQPHFTPWQKGSAQLTKIRTIAYPATETSDKKYAFQYFYLLFEGKKDLVLVHINTYLQNESDPIKSIWYINGNKQLFLCEAIADKEQEELSPLIEKINQNPFFRQLSKDKYFELIKKDWDIEYQIHELGFKLIPTLFQYAKTIIENPNSYAPSIQELLKHRTNEKDNYLIQLYNRIYLNYHPKASIAHLHRYIIPRYMTGKMLKNPTDFIALKDRSDLINTYLNTAETQKEKEALNSLKQYDALFCQQNQISID